ncbi:hypothetical protein OPT61_g10275 [Boeremia exigua]|uniref:Uncharacterized protein n=1 Tax=Boeremia exigua TaxID=749465 RepID=A0ACC2HQI3_9PLEO|nr:hypothetical protein OPT61_g10275 [Boeremia exigua]
MPLSRGRHLTAAYTCPIRTAFTPASLSGLYKLQLVAEAKKVCPEVVIVLGEDLTRFRNASKQLYAFLSSFSWNSRCERLGFDEVWLDVSDLVDSNVSTLTSSNPANSFFRLSKHDPAVGFSFDATNYAGPVYPELSNETCGKCSSVAGLHGLHTRASGRCGNSQCGKSSHAIKWHHAKSFRLMWTSRHFCLSAVRVSALPRCFTFNAKADNDSHDPLRLRLLLASHLAHHIRRKLEHDLGYTATVGISTNKLLSKLVGNLHKPNSQTTLLPPYTADEDEWDNVTPFIDDHEVGKIPGVGFKTAQKLRHYVLQRPADFDTGLVYGGTKEDVRVRDVRTYPDIGPDVLERVLGGPGTPHGIGTRVWDLLNGCDDSPVGQARETPRQISIEDSYKRLDTMEAVVKQLRILAVSLLKRMRIDLVGVDQELPDSAASDVPPVPRWLARPKTLRLSTRPRPPQNPDGSHNRSFARISKSAPMPNFVFKLDADVEALAEKMVREALVPLFRQLHPEKQGWNLSLVNLAATNMVEGASEKGGAGRDIGKMFKRQKDVLSPFKVHSISESEDENMATHAEESAVRKPSIREPVIQKPAIEEPRLDRASLLDRSGSEDFPTPSQERIVDDVWEDDDMPDADTYRCPRAVARSTLNGGSAIKLFVNTQRQGRKDLMHKR